MAKAGRPIPEGMDEAIEFFAKVAESNLSTCYIKADERLVYFWRDALGVIVAMILWSNGDQKESDT